MQGRPHTAERRTVARITYQRFFRRYRRLSGMTGTGVEVSGELLAEFDLRTVKLPTHRPNVRRNLGVRMYKTTQQKWDHVVDTVRPLAEGEKV